MKQGTFQFQYREYTRLEELSDEQARLVRSAIDAAGNAYAPYSGYHVGAALMLENGRIVTGNNQENAAYPSGLCAERVALFYAGSQFPGVAVTSLAIAAVREGSLQEQPVTPCGGCRQVLWEKESQGDLPLEVILYGTGRIQVISSARDLLPLPFILP